MFLTLTSLALLYAMSQPVQKFFFHFLPFFKYFMQPERIIPLFIFFFITIAGYGLDHFFKQEDKNNRTAFMVLIYLLAAVLVSFNLPLFKALFPECIFTVSFFPVAFLFILYNAIYHVNFRVRNNSNIIKATVFILVVFELFFYGMKYIVSNKPINDVQALKLIYHENREIFALYTGMEPTSLYLYKNMNSLPRAYIVNNVKTIDGPPVNVKKALEKLDPHITAIIEKPVPLKFKELAFSEDRLNGNNEEVIIKKVEIVSYGNDEIKLKTSLEQKGFMVFSDTYYPGWELWDNGIRKDIYRTNHAFRSAFLETGDHDLTFKFNPKSYKIGAIISFVSGILIFIFLLSRHFTKGPSKNI